MCGMAHGDLPEIAHHCWQRFRSSSVGDAGQADRYLASSASARSARCFHNSQRS